MNATSDLNGDLFEIEPEFNAYRGVGRSGARCSAAVTRLAHELEGEVRVPLIPPSMRIVRCDPAVPECGRTSAPSGTTGVRRGREYARWVQRALNGVLGLRLVVDGIIGRQTRNAIRQFQQREGLRVDGIVGRETERRLVQRTGTEPPPREGFELETPAAISAGAAAVGAGIQLVKFGFETIRTLTHGEIRFTGPTTPVGIRALGVLPNLRLQARTCQTVVIDFEDISPVGVEQVNIKLRCIAQYDGLNLDARFIFDPEGRRSRLMRDTFVTVHEPLSLERQTAPRQWQDCRVAEYGVLRIPVEFRVDRPWPLSNYNENFTLVLSTMHGFGASASDRQHIKDQRVAWN